MVIINDKKKSLLNFLIRRWEAIIGCAAIERVNIAICEYLHKNNIPIANIKPIPIPYPSRQIKIIKQYIIKILPEVHFIDYVFETQPPLNPNDFIEMYIADNHLCISKIREVMSKMEII